MQGKKHGLGGYYSHEDGNFYYGQWEKDRKSGFGIMFLNDERVYKGFWVNDHFKGMGILKSNILVLGHFENSKLKDGPAQVKYGNGDYYVGFLKNHEKEGRGKYFYSNGDTYEGEWKNGMKEGKGEMQFKNGAEYIG